MRSVGDGQARVVAKLDSAEGLDVLLDRYGAVERFVGDLAGALFFD